MSLHLQLAAQALDLLLQLLQAQYQVYQIPALELPL
jgi:hypothetical protein